ncbi:Hypothetical protein Minf_2198 [Methylacidiphilum infernorum V4]|uniref:Uncharacterized protein n=1 Tax=Methylacidiphilum infernorum (isolate V4) TaxID=481448 RepID=B3DZR7_METI4|nr:Hypothetical protein Minf_2198 [Methylacidiphilum infernorum V4]
MIVLHNQYLHLKEIFFQKKQLSALFFRLGHDALGHPL